MSIEGFSDRTRLERLGRIRLGIRVPNPKNPELTIPKATDHFVCPPEVQKVYGEQPQEIYPIMFPTDNPDDWMSQFYRCYGQSYGLTCMGDGLKAARKVDTTTGAMADRSTPEGKWIWTEGLTCEGEECDLFLKKQCRPIMRLQFLLPEVPGLGVYEIATTSFHSRLNIQSTIRLIQGMTGGRIRMIPLALRVGPQEVVPPGGKKKTVWIMHIVEKSTKLADFLRMIQSVGSGPKFFLSSPASQTPEEAAKEEPPDDLLGPYGADGEDPGEAAAQETKKTAKKGSTKTAGDPLVTQAELELGTGSWDKLIWPMVKKEFKVAGPADLTDAQRKTVGQWVKAEVSKKTLRENAEAAKNAPQSQGVDPGTGSDPPAKDDPKKVMKLRKEYGRILVEDAGMTEAKAKTWTKENLGVETTAQMTIKELESAIDKAKAAAASQSGPLF